jgi:nitric oxide reductase large subunit
MEENQSILELQVDQTASKNLSDATRWAKFLSITGFVCMGLMVIFFIAMQSQITSALSQVIPGFSDIDSFGFLVAVIIIVAGIVCLLMYFLFRGSMLIKKGIETKSQEIFNNGLAALKAYFIMSGIIAIIGLVSNLVSLF